LLSDHCARPIDKDGRWRMLPQTVNAIYSPKPHEIVFPAAILQHAFFKPQRRPGRQLRCHRRRDRPRNRPWGLDDQGAKSGRTGMLPQKLVDG